MPLLSFLHSTSGVRVTEALTTRAIMQALMNVNVTIKTKVLLAFWTRNTRSWHISCNIIRRTKYHHVSKVIGEGERVIELWWQHIPGFRRLCWQPKQVFGRERGSFETDGDTSSNGVMGNKWWYDLAK